MMRYLFFLVLLPIISCAPTYVQPTDISNNPKPIIRTINQDYDIVWNSLVEYASTTFFSIDNIEKDSGLLTLNFGSSDPSKYVDCGTIDAVFVDFNGPFVEGMEQFGNVNLQGKMNIFIKKLPNSTSQVRIKSRYILNMYDTQDNKTWSFDTGGSDTKNFDAVNNITCKSTGFAENTILDGIARIANN